MDGGKARDCHVWQLSPHVLPLNFPLNICFVFILCVYICVSMCVCMYTCVEILSEARECWIPWSWELPYWCGLWVLVLWNSSKFSRLLSHLSSPSWIFFSVPSPGGHLSSKEPAENKGLQRVDTGSAVMRLNCPPASDWGVCLSLILVKFWGHCVSAFSDAHLFLSLISHHEH